MSREILKVQGSLATSDGSSVVLIYNESRSIMQEFPMSKELKETLGWEMKKFYWAEIPEEPGIVQLQEEAPWQDW